MSFIPDPNILKELKKLVCQAIGRQMDCASDFTILYDWVEKKTHKSLGTNTLKRLWEYGGEVMRVPQKATCDILAQSIGFRDFEDFQQFIATEDDISSSNVVLTKHLDTKDPHLATATPLLGGVYRQQHLSGAGSREDQTQDWRHVPDHLFRRRTAIDAVQPRAEQPCSRIIHHRPQEWTVHRDRRIIF